jgi:hypothetical protein
MHSIRLSKIIYLPDGSLIDLHLRQSPGADESWIQVIVIQAKDDPEALSSLNIKLIDEVGSTISFGGNIRFGRLDNQNIGVYTIENSHFTKIQISEVEFQKINTFSDLIK